ncbi:MAG: YkgJ family cysteine cluster protein [Pseudodesulfovibrio sp.]|nr:YkgJ family cysteine cluster protein [Pseudodesulfovibrio sp.]
MTPNLTSSFVLGFANNAPLRLDLSLPDGSTTVHEILPAIFTIAEAIHTRSATSLATRGKPITCGPGCGVCCHQLVPISQWEAAHLAQVVRSMDTVKRSRIIARFTSGISKLEKSGLLGPLNSTYANDVNNQSRLLELKTAYWNLKIPCPFLEDNSCSIHPHRPLSCRQYMVTSAPQHCANIYSSEAAHEVVTHPVDIGGTLASFSGEGLQHSRVLPHIFSLLAERSIRAIKAPTLPAPQMIGRFLDCMATCFSQKN